jgi:2-polyprenyl-3-methyl-5-hydroxy-6-metoxy-1,4-benzoquinol methylase
MLRQSEEFMALQGMLDAQLSVAPEQEKFFRRRFAASTQEQLVFLNALSEHITKLIDGDLEQHTKDYAWLCQEQIAEELHFRREGRYKLSTFEEAYREVYSNKSYMTRYMNGLLMTQLWWSNHTAVMNFYQNRFLAENNPGYSHLEIGPGHGLFLYFASKDPRCAEARGWDISESSIDLTKAALLRLGAGKMPTLELVDLFKGEKTEKFDSIVFSEVLEHMEHPRAALDVLRNLLAPKGRLFLNMPINSPAPDHLFNADSPEDLEIFVVKSGLRIVDRAFFPASNQSIERARKKKLTISCVFVAEPS